MRNHRSLRLMGYMVLSGALAAACSGRSAEEDPAVAPIPVAESSDEVAEDDEGAAAAGEDQNAEGGEAADGSDDGIDAVGSPDDADVGDEVDVTVIPDEITPEYVEAVLAELELLYAEALRELMIAGEPTVEVTDRLGSAFSEEQYAPRLQQFLDLLEAGFPDIADDRELGARSHTRVELLEISDDCIFVQTLLDFSAVFEDGRAAEVSFVLLGLPDRGLVNNRNPTPWMIHGLPVGDERQIRESSPCDS